jgi:hypothetical protein
MNTFDREERMRRLMGGFTPVEDEKPKVSGLAVVLMIVLRVAFATAAVALIDVGLDNDYDLSLWGMVRVAFGGLLVIALITSALAETIAQRLSQ